MRVQSHDSWDPLRHLRKETQELFNRFEYKGQALTLLNALAQYIKSGSRQFFVQWTDHGITHIETVLDHCGNLIHEDATQQMSPDDVFVLLCSTLLHDIAMVFDDAVLCSLLDRSEQNNSSLFKDWQSFVAEIQHWDSVDVENRFGEAIPPPRITDVSQFNNKQNYYAGEFLRRHHGSIARLIAEGNYDLPSAPLRSVRALIEESDPKFKMLITLSGMIAESHCLDLREAIDKVTSKYFPEKTGPSQMRTKVANVHFAYVMSLLRIADYLDFRHSSAQHFLTRVINLRSPISQLEHNTMNAYVSTDWQAIKTESVVIQYDTSEPKVFWNFEKIHRGIQQELDTSWAVLSEHYAATQSERLAYRGLSIRRAYCQNFGNVDLNTKYFPEPLRITVSDSSIIYLLAGPLYSNNPTFAIREIISNAHDACCDHAVSSKDSKDSYRITMILDSPRSTVSFADNGVGMSFDEVGSFFLRVGGRMRNDLTWKKSILSSPGGEYAYASRFGVGAVSLFMLGDQVSVSTKRDQSVGVKVTIKQNTSDIIAEKEPGARGTKINVTMRSDVANTLDSVIDSVYRLRGTDSTLDNKDCFFPAYLTALKYVSYRVPIELQWINSGLVKKFLLPSLEEWFASMNMKWLELPDSSIVNGAKFLVCPAGDFAKIEPGRGPESLNRSYLVYNGIVIESVSSESQGLWKNLVFYLDDKCNRFTFNLEKSRLNADLKTIMADCWLASFEACIADLVSQGQLDLAISGIEKTSNIWNMLPRFRCSYGIMSNRRKGQHELAGVLPYVFFYKGKVWTTTARELNSVEASAFLILAVHPQELLKVLGVLPPNAPVIIVDSNAKPAQGARQIGFGAQSVLYLDDVVASTCEEWIRTEVETAAGAGPFITLIRELATRKRCSPLLSVPRHDFIREVQGLGLPTRGKSYAMSDR